MKLVHILKALTAREIDFQTNLVEADDSPITPDCFRYNPFTNKLKFHSRRAAAAEEVLKLEQKLLSKQAIIDELTTKMHELRAELSAYKPMNTRRRFYGKEKKAVHQP